MPTASQQALVSRRSYASAAPLDADVARRLLRELVIPDRVGLVLDHHADGGGCRDGHGGGAASSGDGVSASAVQGHLCLIHFVKGWGALERVGSVHGWQDRAGLVALRLPLYT